MGAEAVAGLAKLSVLRSCGRTIDEIGHFNRIVRLVGGRRNIYVWMFALGILFGIPGRPSNSWLGGQRRRLPSKYRAQSSRCGLTGRYGCARDLRPQFELLDAVSATSDKEPMIGFQQVLRVFDNRPWAAHLYVTEQCNLDCHYCNEYDNSIPHPAWPI